VTGIIGQAGEQPAVIEQLNLAFDIEQDRMLFKVGLSDNTELAIWITRRIARSISAWLQGSQVEVDSSMQVLVMNEQGGLDAVGGKLMSAATITPEALMKTSTQNLDFGTQYQSNRSSRLESPMLATACKVLTDNATQFVIEFSAKEGISAQIAFNAELKIAFGNMLQLASKEAVWDIGVQSSQFIAPAVTASQVLH
jgi:hypothetical protein